LVPGREGGHHSHPGISQRITDGPIRDDLYVADGWHQCAVLVDALVTGVAGSMDKLVDTTAMVT
jgi:hypothetical protein